MFALRYAVAQQGCARGPLLLANAEGGDAGQPLDKTMSAPASGAGWLACRIEIDVTRVNGLAVAEKSSTYPCAVEISVTVSEPMLR